MGRIIDSKLEQEVCLPAGAAVSPHSAKTFLQSRKCQKIDLPISPHNSYQSCADLRSSEKAEQGFEVGLKRLMGLIDY